MHRAAKLKALKTIKDRRLDPLEEEMIDRPRAKPRHSRSSDSDADIERQSINSDTDKQSSKSESEDEANIDEGVDQLPEDVTDVPTKVTRRSDPSKPSDPSKRRSTENINKKMLKEMQQRRILELIETCFRSLKDNNSNTITPDSLGKTISDYRLNLEDFQIDVT